jgi:hypothetical protein
MSSAGFTTGGVSDAMDKLIKTSMAEDLALSRILAEVPNTEKRHQVVATILNAHLYKLLKTFSTEKKSAEICARAIRYTSGGGTLSQSPYTFSPEITANISTASAAASTPVIAASPSPSTVSTLEAAKAKAIVHVASKSSKEKASKDDAESYVDHADVNPVEFDDDDTDFEKQK